MADIQHIVVLMLENRSFDSMLGMLYPKGHKGFNGLTGKESNLVTDQTGSQREIKVWNDYNAQENRLGSMDIPKGHPGGKFDEITQQLFGSKTPRSGASANMSGFAQNYCDVATDNLPDDIMHYYVPEQIPVLSYLARQYAVCDAWFASAPCQTWPNRFFIHTGTAAGYHNNSPCHFPYLMPTIFTRFNHKGEANGWKIYFHDFPQASALSDLWPYVDQFDNIHRFKEDLVNGTLPSYSFIEPGYFIGPHSPSDQHPPHEVPYGEQIIADVYNNLRTSSYWKNTLLIITYDEHGGCYDHVPPPSAPMPEPARPDQTFAFDRYGVRVPTIVISPYIPAGTIFRAPTGSQPYDHTSVLTTLRSCFDLGGPLTERDRHAPDLLSLLTLSDAQLNHGAEVEKPVIETAQPTFRKKEERSTDEFCDLQKSLYEAAANLPDLRESHTHSERRQKIQACIQQLKIANKVPPKHRTQKEALAYIREKLEAFRAAHHEPIRSK